MSVKSGAVKHLLGSLGGFLPGAIALTLPVVYIPSASDSHLLPRASIVIAGACLGVGISLLVPNGPRLGTLPWPLIAAAGASLLAFLTCVSWPLSLAGSYTRYESLPMRLGYLGLLASSVWLLRTERQRDLLVAAFVFGSSVAALEAIQQAFGHVSFRPDGNLGNANLLAALLVMAIPLAVERALHANWSIAAWSAAIVVMAGGLLATTSRSGFLAVGVAGLVLLTLVTPNRLVGIAAAGSAVLSAVALVLVYASPLRTLNGDPPELRLHLWQDGLHMIAARPLTGWGEDTTGLEFGHFLSLDYATLVTFDRVHAGPLDVAATQGLLGLAATGLVVALVFLHAWRNRSLPGVAGLAAALAGYTVWVTFNFDWSPAAGMFWLLAGATWSASLRTPLPSGEQSVGAGSASLPGFAGRERERGERRRLWLPLLALLLVAAAIILAVLPVLA